MYEIHRTRYVKWRIVHSSICMTRSPIHMHDTYNELYEWVLWNDVLLIHKYDATHMYDIAVVSLTCMTWVIWNDILFIHKYDMTQRSSSVTSLCRVKSHLTHYITPSHVWHASSICVTCVIWIDLLFIFRDDSMLSHVPCENHVTPYIYDMRYCLFSLTSPCWVFFPSCDAAHDSCVRETWLIVYFSVMSLW